jgi:hypothetical protein
MAPGNHIPPGAFWDLGFEIWVFSVLGFPIWDFGFEKKPRWTSCLQVVQRGRNREEAENAV